MNPQLHSISKTSFLKFEQCAKSFFLSKKFPHLRDKLSIDKLLTFRRGQDIGVYAHALFPDGIDVSKTANLNEAFDLTLKLVANRTEVIYEATFIYNSVLVMTDILCLKDGKYYAYEIKSSLKISENYLKDACLQYYVLKNMLPNLEDFFLVTVNGDYVLEETIDPKKFFKRRSVKFEAEKNLKYFEAKINEANLVVEKDMIPNIDVGKHCFRPYQCDFFQTCWKDADKEESIFNLPLIGRDKLLEWREKGITSISELDDALFENAKHLKIKRSFQENKPIINREAIVQTLDRVQEPFAAMDMEIWAPAIPQIKGTRPFQQIPFLVCLYGKDQQHFLANHSIDERNDFAEALIELTADYKSILVFDKSMEELAINGLITHYPALEKELTELREKLVDLFEIFKNLHYYLPAFKSNFSLKVISEVLQTGVIYKGIQSGLEAMNIYDRYRAELNPIEKELMKQQLVEYCMNDAQATFDLLLHLRKIV